MDIDLLLHLLTFVSGMIVGITFLLFIQGATYREYEKKE